MNRFEMIQQLKAQVPKPRVLFVLYKSMGSITCRIRGLIFAEPFRAMGWTVEFVEVKEITEDQLVQQAADFDIVYLLKIPFLSLIQKLRSYTGAKLVFDLTDALWMPHHRWNQWHDLEAILSTVDAVFSDNEFVAAYGRKYNENVHVIPACTQVERFEEVRKILPARDDGTIVIGWVGTVSTINALHVIKEPLERVFLRHPNLVLRLLVLGLTDTNILPSFEQVRFTILPRYDEDEMIREVLRMDIGLFPPPCGLEDYAIRGPLKALIYMTGGVPPVCENGGGCAEIIQDGLNGMLAGSPEEWEQKLEFLIASRKVRKQIGQNALATVIKNNSLQAISEKLADAILNVLYGPSRKATTHLDHTGTVEPAAPAGEADVSTCKSQKKIMISCGHFWPSMGGIENRIEQLGAALMSSGYEVTVLTPLLPERTSNIRNGILIRSVDPSQKIDGFPAWPYEVRRMVLSGAYDTCILIQDPLGNIIWSVEDLSPPNGTRLIIQPIINAFGYAMWKDREGFGTRLAAILRSADRAVCLTRNGTDARFMRESGITPAYIPNASAVPEPAGDFRSTYGIPENSFLVLHVANLYWTKNHIGLLDSLKDMPESWKLVMVGKPTGTLDCADAVMAKLSERPEVLYIPGLSREWVAAAMKAADVIVLSSLGEGAPNTILEAMAHGKPWVATPQCGGANDDAGGIICDLAKFPQYLGMLEQNPTLRQRLGELGRRHWQACLSWPKVVAGWIDLIETGMPHRTFEMPADIQEEMNRIGCLIESLENAPVLKTQGVWKNNEITGMQMDKHVMNVKPIRGEAYKQPPAGTTERFIDVKPVGTFGTPRSCYQSLNSYEIHGFGRGLDAVRKIIAHIFANKLATSLMWNDSIWERCLVVNLACELRDANRKETFDVLKPKSIMDIHPEFAVLEGSARVSDIENYARSLAAGSAPPPTLYVSGAVLNMLGGAVGNSDLFMIDGARRLVAQALNHRRQTTISVIVTENEFPRFLDQGEIQELHRSISALSWFKNYQSIPLVGIQGERSLTRFSLMDMSLLRDSRVIDFGCNIGQASLKAVMAGAREVFGIEGMPDTYGITSRIGALSGFSNIHFLNVDFNATDFREQIDARIPGQVDYSFFFSVYRTKELIQRDVLFQYIIDKTSKGIFFEGHADPKIDSLEYYNWLFESFGLTCHYLGNSEGDLRPLFFLDMSHRPASRAIPAVKAPASGERARSFVNIGMITYNRLEFTRQAIAALTTHTDFPYVLTVVDNNSQDGTREHLLELKRRGTIKNLVLLDENIGVAKASNLAWSLEPEADYYLKLDNDIVIQKHGWLGDMVRIIDDEQSFGALAYSFEPTSYPLVSVNGHSVRLKNGNLGGACFLIPARTREKIGFWCEDYGLYSEEDYDYCFRLSLSGLRYAYMADEEVGFHLPAGKAAKIDENSLIATDGVEETSQQTYRLWKDEIRRQTISSGLRDRNLLGYKNGTKSICIASHYTTAWINAGRPGLVQPSFQSVSSHPMKVAVFSHDGSHHACGYYRVYSPAKALGGSVSFTWPVKTENGSFKVDLSELHECDLFIIQRFFPHEVSMPFIEQLMGMGSPVIFELDDLITDIPADNSTHDWAQQCLPHIEEVLKKCAAITASTEELGIKLSCYNEHVYVLPNLIDLTLWRKQAPRSCGPVVIGYAGTMTHASDIALLEPVLERLSAKYGNNVAFTFMGCATERLSKLAGFQFIPFELSFEAYAKKLQDTPFDIMLAPLEDNVFNRCKSNIKWLEYSSCGIAGVYADLPPYNTSVKQGETGLLVGNDAEQWFQAICLLIDQPALRRKIAEQSRNEVLTNYTLDKNAGLWLEAYQEIMEKFHNESLVPASMAVPQQQDCKVQLVSIVIPVFNQLYFTQQCLQALFETLPTKTGCEIIVVNNASSDGTAAYLHGLGERVRVSNNATNLGFAKACNQGAQAAQGKYLLFLNNDTVVQPGWLEPLLKAIQYGEADICGARLLYPDGRCQHAGIAFDERGLGYHIFAGFPGDAPEVTQRREMQAVTGACLMISKQLFAELEGFDEEFHNGFEDVDLCLRAGEYGKKILYLPESVVIHYAEQTPGRKDHDIPNMQRFSKRWSGKLRQDDQQLYRQFGLTCSKDQEGRFRIARDAGSVPQVSIIIPLFNQVGLTQACLAALQRATKAGSYELVLVDNGSTDGTAELLEQWRHAATVIRNLENGGFAKACNQGARAAQGKYLLFLNNDTVVQHGWLEPLLEVLEQDASVAATGSKLLYPDGTIQHAGVLLVDDQQQGDPLVARHLYQRMPGDHPAANVKRAVQALTAACLLVRREDFEAVDGFDEGYWNGYEDVDLCLKLAAAGKRLVYQPLSVVVHHESQSGPERFRQAHANIQRLHQRWLGKVQVDAIIKADGAIQHGPGMLNGTTAIYQPPGAPAAVPAKQPTASARPRQYQLVPLVTGSASSLLQRLSSSRTTRDVLQRYTTDV